MGLRDKFLKGCALLCATMAIISCLNACKDKTPVQPTTTYTIVTSSSSTKDAYNTLKSKLISSYSDIEELDGAKWEDLSILYVYQDSTEFRDLSITAAVPVDDEDYEYCLLVAEHNGSSYKHDQQSGFENIGQLYPCINQNKEHEVLYYSGSSLGDIAENFKEEDYTVTTELIDESYYTFSDSMIDMIKSSCNNESLNNSNFFRGTTISSYLTYVFGNEVHIYNTESLDMVKFIYSQEFKSFQESHQYLTSAEYTKFTQEQLSQLGYTFTPVELNIITKKK